MEWQALNTDRYYDFINQIIRSRGQWGIENEYYEGHHIIPKCFGGNGKTKECHENIIRLYPREHFCVHKILAEDNPNNNKIVSAWCMMAFPKTNTQQRDFPISEDEYARLRIMFGNIRKNVVVTNETKEKLSKSHKGIHHPPFSEEHKLKLSESNKHPHNISEDGMETLRNNSKNYLSSLSKEDYKKHCDKMAQHVVGTKWFTNGEIDVREYECPQGFWRGRSTLKNATTTKGKHFYNNGICEVVCEECPNGYVKGRLPKNVERERDAFGRFTKSQKQENGD